MNTQSDNQSRTQSNTQSVAPEFDDMQALVRFGHGRLQDSCFMLLTVRDAAMAGSWLQDATFESAASKDTLPDSAMQIAFTPAGLQKLNLTQTLLDEFSDEFLVGMAGDEARSRRLGDVDKNAPQHWSWGYNDENTLHILLLLYAKTGELEPLLTATRSAQFNSAFEVFHVLPTDTLGAREPFGFVDGISQPSIDWNQNQRTDVHSRSGYSNLLAPGEIVLGYPNEYGQLTRRPLSKPTFDQKDDIDLGRNGSYLVIRQLEQHVNNFTTFFNEQCGGDTDAAQKLAALVVGRHQNGEPLVSQSTQNIPGILRSNALNHFNYDADPQGQQCPVSSHIRRSNPRTGDFSPGVNGIFTRLVRMLGFKRRTEYEDLIASTRFHRILRRGRTYGGASANDASGLQFVCLGANILRQFEFIQGAWSTSSAFAGLLEQRDPLIAHRQSRINGAATHSFTYASDDGPQHKVADLPQFVTVRGGAYFFMPGLKAIRYLGQCAAEAKQ